MVPVSPIVIILPLNQYWCTLQTTNRFVNIYFVFQDKVESGQQYSIGLVIYNR